MQGRTGTFVVGWRCGSDGPVGRGQALNGCSHLVNFLNYNGARVAIAT